MKPVVIGEGQYKEKPRGAGGPGRGENKSGVMKINTPSLPGIQPLFKEISRSGVTIRISNFDGLNLLAVRTKGKEEFLTAAISPVGWASFKNALDVAEKTMLRAGWLNMPRSERGEILQLVRSGESSERR